MHHLSTGAPRIFANPWRALELSDGALRTRQPWRVPIFPIFPWRCKQVAEKTHREIVHFPMKNGDLTRFNMGIEGNQWDLIGFNSPYHGENMESEVLCRMDE